MLTLYGFGRVNQKVIGETRDLRIQWVLEEVGLPYRVHGIDHIEGENLRADYRELSPFAQIPAIDDDGFVVSETGAIALYLAERAGKLVPADFRGRTQVTRWSFAVLNTLEPALMQIAMIDLMGTLDPTGAQRRPSQVQLAQRFLSGLESWLEGRTYLATETFSIADLLLANVLRQIRKTGMLDRYPRLRTLRERGEGRPAWRRACALYERRLGVEPGYVQ